VKPILAQANSIHIPLADESVHMVCTSPPYLSLRDYGLLPIYWQPVQYSPMPGTAPAWVPPWFGCLGMEPTPELFVGHLVLVFREVWRVLRGDGVVWLNLGDSYSQGGGTQVIQTKNASHGLEGMRGKTPWIASKQLCFIPERVALALQADGWWVRSKPPWLKFNGMPESVRDRPTVAHENWYLLAKGKQYYYDQDAVREPSAESSLARVSQSTFDSQAGGEKDYALGTNPNRSARQSLENFAKHAETGRQRRTTDFWNESLDALIAHYQEYTAHLKHVKENGGMLLSEDGQPLGLMYGTKPYKGSHFATFNPDLVLPMLKSSISERGVCPKCGKPWVRVVERSGESADKTRGNYAVEMERQGQNHLARASGYHGNVNKDTIAWHPSCTCQGSPLRGPVTCGKCGGTGKEKVAEAFFCGYKQQGKEKETFRNDTERAGGFYGGRRETGNPCPTCKGTGTIIGDIWPDDVDTWEVAPSIVLDPFAGTGTVGAALASLQTANRYPGMFVGLDLKLSYLADLSRQRLQIEALNQWEQGIDGNDGKCLDGLPLFKGLGDGQT
jgi:DNA modification methylase